MGRGRGPLDASYRLGDDEADNGRGRSEASLDLRSGVLFEGIPSRLRSPIKKKMTKNLFLVTLFGGDSRSRTDDPLLAGQVL